ncbi:MAG: serine/threonine-protein kinase [Myxococcota bacterium]|nr:serine/threonine-protein kinase [Myxococcota bacterium]
MYAKTLENGLVSNIYSSQSSSTLPSKLDPNEADETHEKSPSGLPALKSKKIYTLPRSNRKNVDTTGPRERFISREILGRGTYGEVFAASDQMIDRTVAIKRYHGLEGEQALQSWLDDVRITSRIDHSRIPTIYDAGLDKCDPYIVMRYLRGRPLSELIKALQAGDAEAHARYPFFKRAELIIQLLHILVASHRQGILHRDIKPENILLSENEELYLIDWGIAIDLKEEDGVGALSGTPAYLSPEQARGDPLDVRSDLYAAAGVGYEFLTLSASGPQRGDLQSYLEAVCEELPKFPAWVYHPSQSGPPPELCQPIWRGLQKAPEDRWESAEAFIHALEEGLGGTFSICCPRTMAKRPLHDLMRWFDKTPWNIFVFYAAVGSFTFLALFGLFKLIR